MKRALSFVLLLLPGCARHFHRDTNAPGITDVENPPADREAARVEPSDPGEEMLAVNPGVLAGGGAREASPHGFGELGVEVNISPPTPPITATGATSPPTSPASR